SGRHGCRHPETHTAQRDDPGGRWDTDWIGWCNSTQPVDDGPAVRYHSHRHAYVRRRVDHNAPGRPGSLLSSCQTGHEDRSIGSTEKRLIESVPPATPLTTCH